jgi:D-alanyl-lipoteichoic acid acyltransferase DltB (MBOAT superfamily)
MTFISIEFVALFFAVFLLYFQLPFRWRNPLLLVASFVFYMWWRPEYVVLILFSVTVDYFVAFGLERSGGRERRRFLLVISIVTNLGLLFFFKYFAFAADSVRALLGIVHVDWTPPVLDLVLPVGISFHTFQALSYTIDVYRGQMPVERNLFKLWLYVMFFPQLVAGPIERAKRLLPQFEEKHEFDAARAADGARLVLWGMIKKVVIADPLGTLVDPYFGAPERYAGWPLVIASYAFALQIYADFSGYSDIAVGTARIFGFRLVRNFHRPYLAHSPADFWRRWHISLSTWFRDYVYIPLGGRRGSPGRWALAIVATFLLSGLWHGAKWTFVVWGAYHGLLILLSKVPFPRFSRAFCTLLTFHLMVAGWVLFRANSLTDAGYILTHAIAPMRGALFFTEAHPEPLWGALFRVGLLFVGDFVGSLGRVPTPDRWPAPLRWLAYLVGTLVLLNASGEAEVPFIYFQF